jgi:SMP-30/Gluconolactonase/LRE-like region
MRRAVAVLGAWLLACAPAAGQDMDLSHVLIDGEGWRPAAKEDGERLKLGKPAGKGHTAVSPDGGTLVATAPGGRHVYASRIDEGGGLSAREGYYALRGRRRQKAIEAGGLTFDRDGRLYVATATGVQVFDPTGRLCGELLPPEPGKKVNDVAFGGKGRDVLFVLSESGKVFSRKVRSKGVAPAKEK